MSVGVAIFLNSSVFGSQRSDSNLPASKLPTLLPDPAMISTLPVYSSAAWTALTRMFAGTGRIDQCPLRRL
jgi:hypothetical protein